MLLEGVNLGQRGQDKAGFLRRIKLLGAVVQRQPQTTSIKTKCQTQL
jgi:hypothetical protein